MNRYQDFNREVPPREAMRLLYISKSSFGGQRRTASHTNACSEMFYCLSGRGRFVVGAGEYPVEPDDLLILHPRVRDAELHCQEGPLEYVALGIEGVEFLQDSREEGCTRLVCRAEGETIRALLRMLVRETDAKAAEWQTVCQDLLEVLLVQLVRMPPATLQIARASLKSKECAAAKRYLDENFHQSISLDQLAAVTHINKFYLAHAFQKEYNISPINYLLRRRIDESKTLLRTTDRSLTQISKLVGFSSPSYFSQSFRRLEGMSPIEYRRATQKTSSR